MRHHLLLGGLLSMMLASAAVSASAREFVVFNSVPAPLPGNVVSEGFECCQVREFGDAIAFPAGTGGKLTTISVVMSSWACMSGNWFTAGTCITKPGAEFSQPITMTVYEVDNTNAAQPKAGAQLASVTQAFQIPYRPSSDTAHCPDGQHWFSSATGQCYHGIAAPITFDFSGKNLSLPGQIAIGVSFSTSDAGPSPLGARPCRATVQGCPYDSLNVSADGSVFFQAYTATTGGKPTASSVIDPNGVFVNYLAGTGCGAATPGVFQDDTTPNNGEPSTENCWTGLHPQLTVRAKCGDDEGPFCPAVVGGQPKEANESDRGDN